MTRRTLQPILFVGLLAGALITLLPFLYLVAGAFKTKDVFYESSFLPPGDGLFGVGWGKLSLDNFRHLFFELDFGRHVINSVFLASTTSILCTLCSAMGGYALARFQFKGRRVVTGVVLAALLLPPPRRLARAPPPPHATI